MSEFPCGFIGDGYTKDGYIKGDPNYYPPLNFKHRPCRAVDQQETLRQMAECNRATSEGVKTAENLAAGAVASRIKWWDLTDESGNPVPISRENVLKLEPHLGARLFKVILGIEPSDPKPANPDDKPEIPDLEADTKN